MMCTVGVCSVLIVIGGQCFRAKFTILVYVNHDVLGIYFLLECSAMLDCGTYEILLRSTLTITLLDDFQTDQVDMFSLSQDVFLPGRTATFVPMRSRIRMTSCSGLIDPDYNNAIKKNVLAPQSVVKAIDGWAFLWTVNTSMVSVALPAGLKLGTFEVQVTIYVRTVALSSDIS